MTRRIPMDPVAAVAKSVQDVNGILAMANEKTLDLTKKQMEVSVEMKIGPGSGNGNTIDEFA
jgi:hypothetical protein